MPITFQAHDGLSTRLPALITGVGCGSQVTPITTARSLVVGSSGLFPDHFSMRFRHRTVTDRRGR